MSDEHDLYSMALESPKHQPSTSADSSEEKRREEESSSTNPNYAVLFRKLLIGSRTEISRLAKEKEQLERNLQSAISSGGVVTCPNCTHHFNDRMCLLRPRAMKKMRARCCVELEFNNEEELTTWLFLNQLETNNDGLPTVMKIKKHGEVKPHSLNDVGSVLPELVKKQEEERKVRLKIKKDEVEKEKKKLEKKERKAKREEKEKDAEVKKPLETSKRKRDVEDNKEERAAKVTRRSEEAPTTRRPLSERLQFPTAKPAEPEKPEKPVKPVEPPELLKPPKPADPPKPAPTVKIPEPPAPEKSAPTPVKPPKPSPPKRAPIVWGDAKPTTSTSTSATAASSAATAKQFEFKIPKKKIEVKVSPTAPTASTTIKPKEPKQKITFVSTAQKKAISQEVPVEKRSSEASVPAAPLVSTKAPLRERPNPRFLNNPAPPTTWQLIPVKKSPAVLDHIWKHAQLRMKQSERCPNKKMVIIPLNRCLEVPQEKVINLKDLGISEASIALIRMKNAASSPVPAAPEQPVPSYQEDHTRLEHSVAPHQDLPSTSVPPPAPAAPEQLVPTYQLEQEDQDILEEFFPTMSTGNRPNSQTDIDSETASIGSIEDREENELLVLVREDSAVPPDGDCLLELDEDVDKTLIDPEREEKEDEETGDSDYGDFCLEDVGDFDDDTIRERKLSEASEHSEKSETSSRSSRNSVRSEENMDWMENMGDGNPMEDESQEDDDEEEYSGINPLEESGGPTPEALVEDEEEEEVDPESEAPEPESPQDSEDLISPMTSTPKHQEVESDEEIFRPHSREDSFVDELDWNYGIEGFDDDEEEEKTVKEPEKEEEEVNTGQKEQVGGGVQEEEEVREDGELSDEEKKPEEKRSPKKKKTLRERIEYHCDARQVAIEDFSSEEDEEILKRCRKPKVDTYKHRRRSSEENRHRTSSPRRSSYRRSRF